MLHLLSGLLFFHETPHWVCAEGVRRGHFHLFKGYEGPCLNLLAFQVSVLGAVLIIVSRTHVVVT